MSPYSRKNTQWTNLKFVPGGRIGKDWMERAPARALQKCSSIQDGRDRLGVSARISRSFLAQARLARLRIKLSSGFKFTNYRLPEDVLTSSPPVISRLR